MIPLRSVAIAVLLSLAAVPRAGAQTGDNILLVTNALSQVSDEIGEYYARKRAVPGAQILRLPLPFAEEIDRREYEAKIEKPIAEWLIANAAEDRILYLILAKDVPLRIAGSGGANGTVASVDSELTLLYRRLSGMAVPTAGSVKNPYFLGGSPLAEAARFTHRTFDIYLVGRLDGYTVADVKAMIDRGAAPARQGVVLLDGKLELTESVANKWLVAASAALKAIPGWSDRVVLDTSQATLKDHANVIGYYSWGSNAVAATERHYGNQFLPGALAAEFVSTDARTFKEPPADWAINDTRAPFNGSHQSLIGDLIRDGVTGVAGHVSEPFLNATIRPDILFPAYASGFNLIESFYLAMPGVSWQTVVVGDALCAPFASKRLETTDLNPAVNPATELPAFFSSRRVAALTTAGARPDAANWVAKAEVRTAKKDLAGARQAYEQAAALDAAFAPAQMALAQFSESSGDWDTAIEHYRRVIAAVPSHAVALNNLAYALAVRKNDAAGALPLAKRAYALSASEPEVGDTLAWVQHLLGDDAAAEPIITAAVQRRPDNPEILLHAAMILAASGKSSVAAQRLDAAVRLDPTLSQRADVQDLRARLGSPK